jgi:hypothetical protein
MCCSKECFDVQAEVQADEIFNKLPARNVPLTKDDLRKARAVLQAINLGSSGEGSDRK